MCRTFSYKRKELDWFPGSPQVALRYTREYGPDKVRVMTLVKNRGKGGAVRMVRAAPSWRVPPPPPTGADLVCCSPLAPLKGTMICRGKLILMADADGATKFSDIEKAESALQALSPKPV